MTERDELIGQAAEVLRGSTLSSRGDAHWRRLAERVVDAGWRPPPSGDVVEQAARTLHKRSHEPMATLDNWREYAQTLADAGLLRTPPQERTEFVDD